MIPPPLNNVWLLGLEKGAGGFVDRVSCGEFSGGGGGAVRDLCFRYDSNTVVI